MSRKMRRTFFFFFFFCFGKFQRGKQNGGHQAISRSETAGGWQPWKRDACGGGYPSSLSYFFDIYENHFSVQLEIN